MIEEGELKVAMRALAMDPANDGLREMIKMIDGNGDNKLDLNEFLNLMTAASEASNSDDENMKYFRILDEDNTGKISFKNLKKMAVELGETMSDEEIQDLIDEGDRDGDGEVSMEEFLQQMRYNQ